MGKDLEGKHLLPEMGTSFPKPEAEGMYQAAFRFFPPSVTFSRIFGERMGSGGKDFVSQTLGKPVVTPLFVRRWLAWEGEK